jgi:hypothetical protein
VATPPKFIKDSINCRDIEGTRPSKNNLKITEKDQSLYLTEIAGIYPSISSRVKTKKIIHAVKLYWKFKCSRYKLGHAI